MSRGQVETQFNWIFILVAGSLILLATFGFIAKQRDVARKDTAQTFLEILDEITTSAGIAKGTARVIDLPPIELVMACSDECRCTMEVMDTANKEFGDKLMFGPSSTEGTILFWAQEWSVPFRVANFLYLTSNDFHYYVVYEDGDALGESIEEKLPDLMSVSFHNPDELVELEHTGHARSRLVFVNTDPVYLSLGQFAREDIDMVHLTDSSARFFVKTDRRAMEFDAGDPIPYFGEAPQYAAVFAANENNFKCGMHRASERLGYISRVYLDRVRELNSPLICGINYDDAEDALIDMQNVAVELSYDLSRIGDLEGAADALRYANDEIASQSCPYVY